MTSDALFTYYLKDNAWLWKRVDLAPELYIDKSGSVPVLRLRAETEGPKGDPEPAGFAPTSEGVLYSEKQADGTFAVRVAKAQNLIPVSQDGTLYLLQTSGFSHQAECISGSTDQFRLNAGIATLNDILVFRSGALLLPGIDWEMAWSQSGGMCTAIRLLVPIEAADTVFIHYR